MSYLKIFNEFENYFVVDRMPLEAVKLRKSKRTKICKEEFYTTPSIGLINVN